jgi:hypothetical protein
MISEETRAYLASIGRRGGRTSRRVLSPEQARMMVAIRLARKSFRDFHAHCFWSYNGAIRITENEVPWVADQLRRNGNRAAWQRAAQIHKLLCH